MSAKSKSSKESIKKSQSGAGEVVERGEAMTGAEVLVECLEREGVDLVIPVNLKVRRLLGGLGEGGESEEEG